MGGSLYSARCFWSSFEEQEQGQDEYQKMCNNNLQMSVNYQQLPKIMAHKLVRRLASICM